MMKRKVVHTRIARLKRRFISIVDSDGRQHCTFLEQAVFDIVEQYGGLDRSAFVTSCVLALSRELGGPDRFRNALQWLADENQLDKFSTKIEVSIMYWAGQNGVRIGG